MQSRIAPQSLPGAAGWRLATVIGSLFLMSMHGQIVVPGAAMDAPAVEFLSDHAELLLTWSQSWGELGFNTAAHEQRKAGEALRIGSQTYTSGLGHHASGLSLGGEYERFEAEVGLQPCGGGAGSVVFRVSADGRALFDSGVMRGVDAPKRVEISVAGAQELVLEALDAGDGIACDMANWANARLLRAPGAHVEAAQAAVDVARFARVATSNPDRTDGAKASRLEEYRTEDVLLETALVANADGSHTLKPDARGVACIGLNWSGKQALRELRLRFADRAQMPAPDAARVQGWFGESAWQGHWLPLDATITVSGDEWVARLPSKGPNGGLLQTPKVRWLLPVTATALTVSEIKAFTRSRWAETRVVVEAEHPRAGERGRVRVFNGELLSLEGQPAAPTTAWNEWDLARPVSLAVRYSRPSSLTADATVLQFQTPAGGVGVALKDLLASNCVYVPSRGLFLTLATNAAFVQPLTAYKERIAGRRSILDEVRALPDQTLAQAMAKTHHAAQEEGPVMLSLSCDNTKFVVDRGGDVSFPSQTVTDNDWFASAGDLRVVLGDGRRDRSSRHLDGSWLPIPVITFEREGVRCTQRVFVAPADGDGTNPARLNRPPVCVTELTLENLRAAASPVRVELFIRLAGKPKPAAVLARAADHRFSVHLGLTHAGLLLEENTPLNATAGDGKLALAGTLPPEGRTRVLVFLGMNAATASESRLADVPRLREAVERYWRATLAGAMQIETPDALLNDVIRSSQVRCLIAARNEAEGGRVAPWIAAMSYGPLESEAHSVIRGMDSLGHDDFARRGLEYFIHRYNTNGFLTTGYTTFGTAWHLWTLGEHAQLTADRDWLRRQAPELRRVGDWILRQAEKTRRTDGDGQPIPEFGLMPPGVLADWNAFAYYFMLNGYYHAALQHLAATLGSLGDGRGEVYTRGAAELRTNILRAYRWTQAQSPALPLRDGTWIPHYPSQVHSPGKLADFFPGDDAGRAWAYDTELGAHQLVPTGVLAPDDPEVTRLLNHLEDVQFLGEGWFDYPAAENTKDWFNLGGFAKVQPYYGRNAEVYALRDDVKPFVRSYFNSLASLLNTEVLTLWEHFHRSGAWDKTHETGYFLHQTRTMLVQERGDELWLGALIPSEWLRAGKKLEVAQAPTRFGTVSFRLAAEANGRQVTGEISPPTRLAPRHIVLRLRHPEGRALGSVAVNGREHREFDVQRNMITFAPTNRTIRFTANYD
jgi:hypothetical protein